MIVLNLGCGTPDLRSWHPIEGAINRDPGLDGWRFEDGLGEYADCSVDGITVSHALMYLSLAQWDRVFAEFARVLKDNGVIRITEDATDDTRSRTYPRGWHDVVTLTNATMVKKRLLRAGLVAHDCASNQTYFSNDILIQQQHGDAPDCFWVEGVMQRRVLLVAHADDEVLFSAFTILRYRPHIIICYPSAGDYGDTKTRLNESRDAANVLGALSVTQWDGEHLQEQMRALDCELKPSKVFAPDVQTSHPDHLAVALAAAEVFAGRLTTCHTYDANGKVRSDRLVEHEPAWTEHKLRALARFSSQIRHPRANQWFMNDLLEYWGDDK